MSFDILQGIFDADASAYVSELEDAADASEQFGDASQDLSDDVEGVEGPSEDAAGSLTEIGGAADESVDPLTNTSAELDSLSGAGTEANSQLDPLQGSFDGLGTSATSTGENVGETSESLGTLGESASGVDDSLGQTGDSLDSVGESGTQTADGLSAVGGSAETAAGGIDSIDAGAAGDDLGAVGDNAESAADGIDSVDGAAAGAGDAVGDMAADKSEAADAAGDLSQESDELSTSLGGIDSKATVAGGALAGIGAAGVGAVGQTADMREELNRTGVTMEMSSEEANEMARSLQNATFPMEDVVETMGTLSQKGGVAEEDMEETAESIDLIADATGNTADEIANYGIPIMGTFGEDIEDIGDHADTFAYLENETAMSMGDFQSHVNRAQPVIEDLGLSMEDNVAIMGALTDRGLDASTARREFRSAADEAGDDEEEFYDILGISNEELDQHEEELNDAEGAAEEYRDEANDTITIVDELTASYDDLLMGLGATSGQVETASVLVGGLGMGLMGLQSAGQAAMTGINLARSATLASIPAWTAKAAAVTVAAAPYLAVAAAIGGFYYAYQNNIMGIGDKTDAIFSRVRGAIEPIIGVLGEEGLSGAIRLGREAWDRGTEAIVGGANRLYTGTVERINGITSRLGGFDEWVRGWGGRIRTSITNTGDRAMSNISNRINSGISTVQGHLNSGYQFITGWGGRVRTSITETGNRAMSNITGRIDSGISTVQSHLDSGYQWITGWRTRLVDTFTSAGNNAMSSINSAISSGISTVTSSVNTLGSRVMDYIPPASRGPLSNLQSRAGNIPSNIASGIVGGLGSIRNAASRAASAVSDYLPLSPAKRGDLAKGPYERGEVLSEDFAGGISSKESEASSAAESLAGGVADNLGVDVWDALEGADAPGAHTGDGYTAIGEGDPDHVMDSGEYDSRTIAGEIEEVHDWEALAGYESFADEAGFDRGNLQSLLQAAQDDASGFSEGFSHAVTYGDMGDSVLEQVDDSRRRGETGSSSSGSSSGSNAASSADTPEITITLEAGDGLPGEIWDLIEPHVESREKTIIKKASNGTL